MLIGKGSILHYLLPYLDCPLMCDKQNIDRNLLSYNNLLRQFKMKTG